MPKTPADLIEGLLDSLDENDPLAIAHAVSLLDDGWRDPASIDVEARSWSFQERARSFRWLGGVPDDVAVALIQQHLERLTPTLALTVRPVRELAELIDAVPDSFSWWRLSNMRAVTTRRPEVSAPSPACVAYDRALRAHEARLCAAAVEGGFDAEASEYQLADVGDRAVMLLASDDWTPGRRLAERLASEPSELRARYRRELDLRIADLLWGLADEWLEECGPPYLVRPWHRLADAFAPLEGLIALGGLPIGPRGDEYIVFSGRLLDYRPAPG